MYVGDGVTIQLVDCSTTSLSLGAMFVCFIFVIGLWIALIGEVMSGVVVSLSNQLDREIVSSLSAFLSLPPLINRWNYALLQSNALDISMHNESFHNPTQLARQQLQEDSTFADEMRRRPLNERPYLIYSGASDGAFAGALASPSSKKGALGLGSLNIDVSTGVKNRIPIRCQYDMKYVSTLNTDHVDLLQRNNSKCLPRYGYGKYSKRRRSNVAGNYR